MTAFAIDLASERARRDHARGVPFIGPWVHLAEAKDLANGLTSYNLSRQAEPRTKLRELPLAEMVRTPPPEINWCVDRVVAPGALTLLAGVAGQGKSLVAMAWGIAATRPNGSEVAGVNVRAGTVLYLDAENGQAELHRRVHVLGLDEHAIERMSLMEVDGLDLRHDLDDLDKLLTDKAPSLVVLDSFRSLWKGDERDEAAVAGVLDPLRNLLRRHGAGAVLIHHARRDGSGYRGSGAIAASCELVFLLDRQAEDQDRQRRRLKCEKSRPAVEPPPMWLRLATEDELLMGTPLVTEADSPEPGETSRAPVKSGIKIQVLGLLGEHGGLSGGDLARGLAKDPKDQTVRRALKDLEAEGKIVKDASGRWGVTVTPADDTLTPSQSDKGVKCQRPIDQDTLTPPGDQLQQPEADVDAVSAVGAPSPLVPDLRDGAA